MANLQLSISEWWFATCIFALIKITTCALVTSILNLKGYRPYASWCHKIPPLQHWCQRTITILMCCQVNRFTFTELRTMIKIITVQNQWVVNHNFSHKLFRLFTLGLHQPLHDGGKFNCNAIPDGCMHRVYNTSIIFPDSSIVFYCIH